MNLHASLHMLGASILLPFAHSLGMMQQTLAHPPTFAKQSLYASTSVMNRKNTVGGNHPSFALVRCLNSIQVLPLS